MADVPAPARALGSLPLACRIRSDGTADGEFAMQTIFRAGAALSPPTSRLARLVVVLRTFLSPFLLLFPWLLAGGASAWAADLSPGGARATIVAAATVLDAAQTNIPGRVDVLGPAGTSGQVDIFGQVGIRGHVDVLAQGGTPNLVGIPDTSLAADPAIDANRATAEQLQTLRGIGPAMAARIIAERERQPFASLDDLARRVRGVGARRLRQWQEAGLVLSSRQLGGVQDRAVYRHHGHARSADARSADIRRVDARGTNAQGTHIPVGGTNAHPGRTSTHPPGRAGAAGRIIEVIQGHPRLPSRGATARPARATKGRSAAGRAAVLRSLAEQHAGDAVLARSQGIPATGLHTVSRSRGHRADEPSCRLQRRAHQRSRSGKGAQVRRSKAPPLFEGRPLFDCRSIFDERSRLLPKT